MKHNRNIISSKKGQMTVETVLIISILVFLSFLVKKELFDDSDNNPIYKFISGPWLSVAGMMESGVWANRADAREKHPNHFTWMYSKKGENPN